MTALAHHPHPVTRAVAGVREELSAVADTPVWSMNADDTVATIAEVQSAKAQLAELEARLLTHAGRVDLPAQTGATSTATWHAATTRTTKTHAHRTMRLADGLEHHQATRTALAEGRLHLEQAEAILRALADLPDDLDSAITAGAEQRLLEYAREFDAKHLKVLGRRILEVTSPETADAHEATLLEREERAAEAAVRLTIWDDGHGKTHGRFTLDTLTGAMLKKHLFALAAPRHQASKGPLGERKPTPQRLGQALVELIQRYPHKRLPKAGGLNATVVVTMTLDALEGRLKAARLDTGERLSPGAARRLACEAGVLPAVLDGNSHVLDLGRKQRFASEAQRIAKTIEARGCEIDGCDWPPGMTHTHHRTRWADGGKTNLRDLISLCPHHHARAHDPRYHLDQLPTGKYTFHRRT
ncbi:HNH endonuclease signature motif containing protein [Nocardioides halotolerans]|uniref:HNH endonuclease signature motif containing protein n=1 Tax=Nocardioides halotolerans TaxID=433660 RepID=UPI000A0493E7|nr:HNH endonuclease signature motif containing protein [Nocardioides halotolerans]